MPTSWRNIGGRYTTLAVLFLGLGGVIIFSSITLYFRDQRVGTQLFQSLVTDRQNFLQAHVTAQQVLLSSTRGLYQGSENVTTEEFRAFFSTLDTKRHYPSLISLHYAKFVPASQRADVEAELSAAIGRAIRVHPTTTDQDSLCVITQIEPAGKETASVFGFDAYSEPARRDMVQRCRDLAGIAVSAPVQTNYAVPDKERLAFVMAAPHYAGDPFPPTVEERRKRFLGTVCATFSIQRLFEYVISQSPSEFLMFRVYADSAPSAQNMVYAGPNWETGTAGTLDERLHLFRELNIGDKTWTVEYGVPPAFVGRFHSNRAYGIGALGILLCGVAALVSVRHARLRYATEALYEALAKQEEKYRNLLHHAPDAILLLDKQRILLANDAAARLAGVPTPTDLEGRSITDFIAPAEKGAFLSMLEEVSHSPTRVAVKEFPWFTVSSEPRYCRVSALATPFGGKNAIQLIAHDMTERRALEEQVQSTLALVQTILHVAPLGFFILDEEGIILEWNPTSESISGWSREEVIGKHVLTFFPEQASEFFSIRERVLAGEFVQSAEVSMPRKDGRHVEIGMWVRTFIVPTGERRILAFTADITEQKKVERALAQASRMESIGMLAGGIAHDFNNILTAILGFGEFVREATAPGTRVRNDIEQVLTAARRAQALTARLLAFSRRQMLDPRILNLNDLLKDIEPMLRRVLPENIHIEWVLAQDLANTQVDASQFEQVVINLATNARDAMPEGGCLVFETMNVELDEDYARTHPGVVPGKYVLLAVTDSGTGIPPEVLPHIFEPFFTTKEKGSGTGLGLATVYGIVKQSGGSIWVYSEVGKGTTFKIYFPAVASEKDAAYAYKPDVENIANETVFVVEDEEAVRKAIVRLLERRGYRVLEAGNAKEALHAVRQYAQPIHLLITDVVLPDMNGKQVALAIQRERPEIKVLFISGYAENAIFKNGVLEPGIHFMSKPFTAEGLYRAVRKALEIPPHMTGDAADQT